MLDTQMKDQIKTVFAPIQKGIELVYAQSSHPDQKELVEMLEEISGLNPLIKTRAENIEANFPQFHIEAEGKPNGVYFKGIPGGHEFTSLILAILNSAGLGKLPDANTALRIKNLKGPIELTTYISLTCENCPDVVQALNQMAIIHGGFKHHMTDGGYVQEQISALGIQGVPSVVHDGKLIHSGKISFLDLLSLLESTFGKKEASHTIIQSDLGHFDVVVVGGGPAGASAAIYSIRKGPRSD